MLRGFTVPLTRSVARSGSRPTYQNNSDTVKYVETANTSQIRGLLNCGQIDMLFGYGNSQYAASHGRPVWMSGKRPAHMTAKIVMPSANRLIDVRQPCLSSSRIAEISVPAWPMPIHQTKLMIAKPQPIGMLTPQIPVPLMSSQVTPIPSMPMIMKPIDTTMNHVSGVLLPSTTLPILSVIDPNVCPGSMSGPGS